MIVALLQSSPGIDASFLCCSSRANQLRVQNTVASKVDIPVVDIDRLKFHSESLDDKFCDSPSSVVLNARFCYRGVAPLEPHLSLLHVGLCGQPSSP